MPKDFLGGLQPPTGVTVLNVGLLAEMAASLGNTGRRVEATISALKEMSSDDSDYQRRMDAAADAVHSYFVQREFNGFADHADAIKQYGIVRS